MEGHRVASFHLVRERPGRALAALARLGTDRLRLAHGGNRVAGIHGQKEEKLRRIRVKDEVEKRTAHLLWDARLDFNCH